MIHRSEVFEDERGFSLGWKGRLVILTVALLGLSFFLYQDVLRQLISSVLNREGSSHGLFVPFLSGYFFWLKREKLRDLDSDFALLPGGALVAGSYLLLYLSRGSAGVSLAALSFLLLVAGLVLVLFGMQVFKELSFPLLFLITMIPLSETTYAQLAEWMRAATTAGSVWLSQLMQLPIFRDGYSIQLPNANLFVAMSCSGIRYLLSFFVFSLAYAFLCKRGIRSRILVVVASLPISLAAGVLRLTSIYLSIYFIGAFMAGKREHILVSWIVFGVVLVVAIGADQYFSAVWVKRKESAG